MSRRRYRRRAVTTLEVIVAFSLLTSALALSTPLVVAHYRLQHAQRGYCIALGELTNQFERLSLVEISDLPAAVEKLTPSSFAAEHLPEAKLRGSIDASELGHRITLELTWDEPNRSAAPVRLTSWRISSGAQP